MLKFYTPNNLSTLICTRLAKNAIHNPGHWEHWKEWCVLTKKSICTFIPVELCIFYQQKASWILIKTRGHCRVTAMMLNTSHHTQIYDISIIACHIFVFLLLSSLLPYYNYEYIMEMVSYSENMTLQHNLWPDLRVWMATHKRQEQNIKAVNNLTSMLIKHSTHGFTFFFFSFIFFPAEIKSIWISENSWRGTRCILKTRTREWNGMDSFCLFCNLPSQRRFMAYLHSCVISFQAIGNVLGVGHDKEMGLPQTGLLFTVCFSRWTWLDPCNNIQQTSFDRETWDLLKDLFILDLSLI